MKHHWTKFDPKTKTWIFDSKEALKCWDSASVIDGVVRWDSNNNVPPQEILNDWKLLRLSFDWDKSSEIRENESSAYLKEYIEQNKNREYSLEEISEMKLAFGEGEVVINCLTGEKIQL